MRRLLFSSTLLLVPTLALGQTSYPMITHADPVAVQRGQSAEVTVEGQQNLLGANRVLIEGAGVSADVVKGDPSKPEPAQKPAAGPRPVVRSVKLKFTAAENAPLGVREFRILTDTGISSVGQLLVVDAPVVRETADNNTSAKATAVEVPSVACGKIEALEDVDWFKFKAEAGQTLTFEVFAARIQDKIHDLQKHADPMITILEPSGRELASNDDFYFADSMLSHKFEQGGEYLLQLRDSKYDGDPRWVYALCLTDRPYASHVFPLAVAPGQKLELEPVGSARLAQARIPLEVPPQAPPGLVEMQLDAAGKKTNPVTLMVTPLPLSFEQEPNDEPARATPIPVPGCVNARIGVKRDLDHFLFPAKQGRPLRFEVKARRFGTGLVSGLDASIDVLDKAGKVLASGDDISPAIKDAALVFTPPADGDYVLRVRDLLSKGGETFVYALEVEPVAQDFTLRCDCDKAMIGPGSSTAWYVHVTRLGGFTGPVSVEVKGLPKGVTASPLVIPPQMTQGVVVLTAATDAPKDAANVQVVGAAIVKGGDPLTLPSPPGGRGQGEGVPITRVATPNQEIYFPGGGRGRFDVNLHTVAVTDRSDIEGVEVSPQLISLKPGESVKIDVKLKRRDDFEGPVTLDVRLRHLAGVFGDPLPPGVTMDEGKSKTLLGSKATTGHIVLTAAPNAAPIENVPVSVLANVSINFVVKVSYSSEPILVGVTAK